MRTIALLIVGMLVCFTDGVDSVSAAEGWRAGVGRRVITPSRPMWMSGYASRDRPADGTIHDLHAKVLVLEDPSGRRLFLVSLDLVGLDRETSRTICDGLRSAHGVERSQIVLSTSHTHSGPVVGTNLLTMYGLDQQQLKLISDYTDFLGRSVDAAAADAVSSLTEATVQYGEGAAGFAVNRRNNKEADVPMLREAGQLVGPVDHSVPVLSVRNADGQLRAVVFGYACHATVLSGMQWCGDWPGFAQLEIEARHPGVTALFVAGCGADQNPLPRRTVALAADYGRRIAESVDRVLQSPSVRITGRLADRYEEIPLKLGTLRSREQIEADLKSDNVYLARRAAVLLDRISKHGALDQTYPYPVQVWAVGDQFRLTVLGGEVVVDFSLRLKPELPDSARHWVAGYCNDVMAYIPSLRVLREGGYEGESAMIYYGLPTKWSEDVEEQIVGAVKQLHAALPPK